MRTHFFIVTVARDKNCKVPIYIRFQAGRQIDQKQRIGKYVIPKYWSEKKEELKQIAEIKDRDKHNRDLRKLKEFVEEEFQNLNDKGSLPKDWLAKTIDRHWNPSKYELITPTLFSFVENYIEKSKTRLNPKTGKRLDPHRIIHYKQVFENLKSFTELKKKKIDFNDIDLEFYQDFTDYLQGLNLSTNTIGNRLRILKAFLNAAKDEGFNKSDKYKSRKFKAVSEESESIYLNEDELSAIYEINLSEKPGMEKVRDLFIVGCWTGLRFSDLSHVVPENIKENYIHLKQTKTGGKVLIPVHTTVQEILDKYNGELPKPISNQKFNVALKKIAEEAKLNEIVHKTITKGGVKTTKAFKKCKLVTSHSARRSFSTNLYKQGFPSRSIMQITGHKTELSFLKYLKVTPEEHAMKLREFWQKQENILKVV